MRDFTETPDWSTLPVPADDGGTRHLTGRRVAAIPLQTTDGRRVDLSAEPGRVVGVIEQVFYPVFPPDRNAADVAAWLSGK